ncbi:hypothetical protein [Amycolatopsis benzoatilytica]|uniref:hypothetical protein n=1 Tax=Amycolatopsis benzoatilytica TaxID=346045 RepID=UPI000365CF09|nr:hypothetical protein [Amycolatopsis benzoatilytica]
MGKKPRGWWNTSLRDKARAQYQADQIADATAKATAEQLNEACQRGWRDGREALLEEQRQPRA